MKQTYWLGVMSLLTLLLLGYGWSVARDSYQLALFDALLLLSCGALVGGGLGLVGLGWYWWHRPYQPGNKKGA